MVRFDASSQKEFIVKHWPQVLQFLLALSHWNVFVEIFYLFQLEALRFFLDFERFLLSHLFQVSVGIELLCLYLHEIMSSLFFNMLKFFLVLVFSQVEFHGTFEVLFSN